MKWPLITLIGGDYTGKGNSLLTCGLLIFIQIFILFVGYYSFLHQGPGGGERWENVGPFPLPKAPLCFSRFFAFWLTVTQQSRYWWYLEFGSPAAEHKSL